MQTTEEQNERDEQVNALRVWRDNEFCHVENMLAFWESYKDEIYNVSLNDFIAGDIPERPK